MPANQKKNWLEFSNKAHRMFLDAVEFDQIRMTDALEGAVLVDQNLHVALGTTEQRFPE